MVPFFFRNRNAAVAPATPLPAAPAPAAVFTGRTASAAMTTEDVADLEDRVYRITFSNGHSGEYDGAALRYCAPFDLNEVVSIEEV